MPTAEPVWSWESYVPGTAAFYQRLAWAGHVIGGPLAPATATIEQVGSGVIEAAPTAEDVADVAGDVGSLVIKESMKIPAFLLVAGGLSLAMGVVAVAIAWRIVK
jgi:hypothetical protein